MGSVEVEYFDKNNKKHSQQWSRNEDVKIGEEYWVAYNNKNFNEMNLFYTAPIIRDTSKYFEKKGIINWTYARKNKNETRFTYFFNGKKYIRYQSLVDNKIKKGDTVNILINRDKPSIAYVKGNSSITE